MPELPEVETVKRQLLETPFISQKVQRCSIFWKNTLRSETEEGLNQKLKNQTLKTIQRSGKYLIFRFSDHDLIVHLRMTGQFFVKTQLPSELDYIRAMIQFESGYLLFHDVRKFGTWQLVDDYRSHIQHLGPEPLSDQFDVQDFLAKLKKASKAIKPKLLDQTLIAGVGNIYADEALWEAQIHPQTPSKNLTLEDANKLKSAIQKTLQKAIQHNGSSLGHGKTNFKGADGISGKYQYNFNVYQRPGQPCPRCQAPISKIKLAQRGTHFCECCQK